MEGSGVWSHWWLNDQWKTKRIWSLLPVPIKTESQTCHGDLMEDSRNNLMTFISSSPFIFAIWSFCFLGHYFFYYKILNRGIVWVWFHIRLPLNKCILKFRKRWCKNAKWLNVVCQNVPFLKHSFLSFFQNDNSSESQRNACSKWMVAMGGFCFSVFCFSHV